MAPEQPARSGIDFSAFRNPKLARELIDRIHELVGNRSINLMEVQAAHPDITSKKALRPFLASTPFVELEIICGHMPPWLEEHMRQHHLTCARTRQDDGTVRARISHALCGETAPNGL